MIRGNVKVYVIVINNGHSHPADNVDGKRRHQINPTGSKKTSSPQAYIAKGSKVKQWIHFLECDNLPEITCFSHRI